MPQEFLVQLPRLFLKAIVFSILPFFLRKDTTKEKTNSLQANIGDQQQRKFWKEIVLLSFLSIHLFQPQHQQSGKQHLSSCRGFYHYGGENSLTYRFTHPNHASSLDWFPFSALFSEIFVSADSTLSFEKSCLLHRKSITASLSGAENSIL